jgi:hypothetical protein
MFLSVDSVFVRFGSISHRGEKIDPDSYQDKQGNFNTSPIFHTNDGEAEMVSVTQLLHT